MTLKAIMKGTSLKRAMVIAAAGILPTAVLSDEVALKSADGTVNLVGEFVEFKDDNYVIRTALGDLRISAARVRCEGAACPVFETETADVVFAGSDTLGLGMMPLLISGYASFLDAEASTKATGQEGQLLSSLISDGGFGDEIGSYLVTSSSSSSAFSNLLDKSAQFGMSSRRILPAEARELKADGAGNMISPRQEHIVAVDSLVVITNPSNPIETLTIEQLAGIYTGQITNWSEVGGDDAPIRVLNRQDDSGTRAVFENAVFGDDAEATTGIGETIADNNNMAATVNEDANAVGFVGYAFQRGAKPISLVNSCGITTTPDAFSAKTEEYALQRRLYLYNRADNMSESSQQFIDYATSAEADGVIAKAGFIDLGIRAQPMEMDGARAQMLLDPNVDAYEGGVMRAMLSEMVNYDRLSTTFRFKTGSSKLDERGLIDMARLANYLETQPAGTKITFVGFTDDVGAFDSNRLLSENRAALALQELRNFAGDRLANIEFATLGFGEVAPSGCNTNEQGRGINRRVEVWIQADRQG